MITQSDNLEQFLRAQRVMYGKDLSGVCIFADYPSWFVLMKGKPILYRSCGQQ